MTNLILSEMKQAVGVSPDNVGFDGELLMMINSIKTSLVQLGVQDLEIDIDETTVWPAWPNQRLGDLAKHYIQVKLRQAFDPTASENISAALNKSAAELEGRIVHEIAEVPYV